MNRHIDSACDLGNLGSAERFVSWQPKDATDKESYFGCVSFSVFVFAVVSKNQRSRQNTQIVVVLYKKDKSIRYFIVEKKNARDTTEACVRCARVCAAAQPKSLRENYTTGGSSLTCFPSLFFFFQFYDSTQ